MRNKVLTSLLIAGSLAFLSMPGFCAGGTATYNYPINWSDTPDLTYTVTGAPANVCGELWVSRNGGAYQGTAGWACTNGSGSVTKGPWTWSSQTGDETAFSYIQWPDGSTTNTAKHIWDVTCPTTTVTSGTGAPPTSFSGTATAGAWGAGFNSSWSQCIAYFEDSTTGKYWTPVAGAYTESTFIEVPCSISGMPSTAVTWSQSAIPPSGAHTAGHCYDWWTFVTDGPCSYSANDRSFCK
jgi:hypothetical protein